MVDDPEIVKHASAYYYFLESKERAGIERAILSNVFAKDQFDIASRKKYISLVNIQNLYMDVFRDYATPTELNLLETTLSGSVVKQVHQFRTLADNQDSNFKVKASSWFDVATSRMNLLKEIEDTLANSLVLFIKSKQSDAYYSLLFLVVTAFIATTFTLGIMSIYFNINKQTIKFTVSCNASR